MDAINLMPRQVEDGHARIAALEDDIARSTFVGG